MNQRINELIWQCAVPVDQVEDYIRDNNRVEILDKKLDADKFAELIVKECIKIAYQNDIAKFTRDGYVIGQEIEKHFGVEE